jgi:hypothetical protein
VSRVVVGAESFVWPDQLKAKKEAEEKARVERERKEAEARAKREAEVRGGGAGEHMKYISYDIVSLGHLKVIAWIRACEGVDLRCLRSLTVVQGSVWSKPD